MKYINRELSWVEFNQRVLHQAHRTDLPLLERVKFLAITAANLDEFFQVRVGGLMLMKRSGRNAPDAAGLTPAKTLAALRERIVQMTTEQYALFNNTLLPELRASGICLLKIEELTPVQSLQATSIFQSSIFPLLTSLSANLDDAPPSLPGLQVIVACRLLDPENQVTRYALILIPETLGRGIALTPEGEGHAFVLIEDLVARHAAEFFPGEHITATTPFRITRNGDIAVQEDDASDLAGEMEDVLTARRFADTVRLEFRADVPRELAKLIATLAGATANDIYRLDGPPGLSALMELAFLPGFDHLRVEDWPPQNSPDIAPGASMFETISTADLLLSHPYQSFEPVLRFLEEAAEDPHVIAIKQVVYRTAKQSRIIDALIKAAENGKHVTALIELKARFDEARNLDRADDLQRAGAQIVYGVEGLKTHAKICLVIRRESGHLRRYVHLGTGNYNEATSRIYTDFSYFTCKPEFGNDASLFFNAVTGRSKLLRFQRLVPAPTAMKPYLLNLISDETERANQGLPAKIMAKMNSLQDPEMIAALYAASKAGVEIRLNIRGICCLKPGDPKFSKNIEVISVIDRFLEHARVFYFHQSGEPSIYIASADWMTRNLEKRIELMIPIEDRRLKRRIIRMLEAYFQDNTQAFKLLLDGTSQPPLREKKQKAFRAQEHFYQQAKAAAKSQEHERAMTFESHVPAV